MSYTEEENVVSFFGLVVLAVDGVYDEKWWNLAVFEVY